MPAIRRRWTTADVRAFMDEHRAWPRYELIDGELLVTPAPGSPHQVVVGEIFFLLKEYLRGQPLGLVVMSPADLELRPGTLTQPDVFVIPAETRIAGEQLQWPDVKSLLLAVEVLSPSSIRTDRVEKRDFYMEASVDEYWVVDVDARVVERWTPVRETPELLRGSLTWQPAGGKPLNVDLTALFDRIAKQLAMFRR